MDHWRATLPVTIHEVDYEEAVTDLEPVARRLVSALGLEWDPGLPRVPPRGRCRPDRQRDPGPRAGASAVSRAVEALRGRAGRPVRGGGRRLRCIRGPEPLGSSGNRRSETPSRPADEREAGANARRSPVRPPVRGLCPGATAGQLFDPGEGGGFRDRHHDHGPRWPGRSIRSRGAARSSSTASTTGGSSSRPRTSTAPTGGSSPRSSTRPRRGRGPTRAGRGRRAGC